MSTSIRMTAPLLLLVGCGGAPEPAPETAAPSDTSAPTAPPIPMVNLGSESPIAEIRLVFQAGSAYDPAGKAGLGWLTAHTMASGGTEALTYPQLLETLHPWAASVGVQIDREQLVFYARCHKDHLEAFYPVLRDVLLRPRLAQADFERLQQKALTTLTREVRNADDEALSKLVLESVLFAGHPYAHPSLGTEAGLKSATLADVKAHRAAVLTRARLTIGVAGAGAGLVDRLQADLLALPAGSRAPALGKPAKDEYRLVVVEQPTAQSTAIALGHTLPVRRGDADFPALALTASYFGEHRQFHGVLFQSIREARGMNYGDYAYVEAFRQEGWGRMPLTNVARSLQHFLVWIRPVPSEDRHFALRIAAWNLHNLVRSGVSEEAFTKTRDFLGGYLYLQAQTDMRRLGYALDDRYYGLEGGFADGLRTAWKTLDAAKVSAAVKRHIHPEAVTVVVITADARGFADAVLAEAPSPKKYASPKPEAVTKEDAEIAALKLGFTKDQVTVIQAASLFAR